MTPKTQRVTVDEIVAEQGTSIIVLEDLFRHARTNDRLPFMGAVGSELRPVEKQECEYRMSPEGLRDYGYDKIYQELRASRSSSFAEQFPTFEDWVDSHLLPIDTFDHAKPSHEEKVRELCDLDRNEYPVIENIGGGQIFGQFVHRHNVDKIHNPNLWPWIERFEAGMAQPGDIQRVRDRFRLNT